MTQHLVLLGDSIFDNRAYTAGEPDVVSHLGAVLPAGWRATLCAVDGSITADLPDQVEGLPADASHLAVSIGGNDALMNSDLLSLPVKSTTEALDLFGDRVTLFEASYRAAIGKVLRLGLPTTVCTIYNGNFPDPQYARTASLALAMFNDVILRIAFELSLSVIDLRLVCTEPGDYANPIEPSGRGGLKIARAIARAVGALEEVGGRSGVVGG
ncbi:MAG TPA: SGNH/GDSL hydrolase family protein [Thermoanaerobaculia bacterium]|nr:SGNH/GDSL hydrolase family protein [Thermoanaerobaculia bacterium]